MEIQNLKEELLETLNPNLRLCMAELGWFVRQTFTQYASFFPWPQNVTLQMYSCPAKKFRCARPWEKP